MPNPNPKLPKRKKSGIGRNPRGKKKRSSYDYSEARASLGLPAKATFTQVLSHTMQTGPNPPQPRSPLKIEVKAKLAEEQKKNELLSKDMDVAKREAATKARHISTLKAQVRALSEALQAERKKSRATVAKLLDDAEGVMAEACGIQSQADHKMSAAEQKLFEEKQKMKAELHNERQFYSREIAACKHLCLCSIMYYRCSHTFVVSTFYIIVKDKQEQQLQKQQSEFKRMRGWPSSSNRSRLIDGKLSYEKSRRSW